MKRIRRVSICLFLCLLFTACNMFNRTSSRLAEVDRIIEREPDSAYNMLNRISGAGITTQADSAFYGLLYSQARYKLEKKTDTTLISKSISYFRKHENARLLQRCYYYYSSILGDNNEDIEKQILSLKQAENLITKVNDTLMTLRIYEALATANQNAFDSEESLKYAELELDLSRKQSDKGWVASALFNMSMAMMLNGKPDRALFYIHKVENQISSVSPRKKAMVYNNFAAILRESKNPDYSLIEKYLNLSLSYNDYPHTKILLAELYLKTSRKKQALKIYSNILNGDDKELKLVAYSDLDEYYSGIKDYKTAHGMAHNFDSLYFLIEDSLSKANLKELQMKYDNDMIVRNNMRERGRLIRGIQFVAFVILSVVLFVFRKYYKYKILLEKYRSTLTQAKYELVNLKNDNYKTLKEKELQLKKILSEKKVILRKFERELSSKDVSYTSQLKTLETSLQFIFHLAKEDNFSQYNKKEREVFIELYRMFEPGYVACLDEVEPDSKLTTQEKLYCILRHMKKSDDTIKRMFCWSDEALRKTRSRALNKLRKGDRQTSVADKI